MSAIAEPAESLDVVEECAKQALEAHGLTVTRILRVSTESILFIGPRDRPMTAWVSRLGTQIADAVTESGFPAEPAAWVVRALGHKPGQKPTTTAAAATADATH